MQINHGKYAECLVTSPYVDTTYFGEVTAWGKKYNLSWGLFFKLILSPLIIFVLFVIILKQKGNVAEICLLGAALGPMNTAAIIASKYGLNPPLASAMAVIGIPVSLIGVITLYFLIH